MGMDPSMGMSALGASAISQAIQNNMTGGAAATGAAGNASATFNGTISDLKEKYPELYKKLVLEPLAYQIVQQVKDDNERFIARIKEDEK